MIISYDVDVTARGTLLCLYFPPKMYVICPLFPHLPLFFVTEILGHSTDTPPPAPPLQVVYGRTTTAMHKLSPPPPPPGGMRININTTTLTPSFPLPEGFRVLFPSQLALIFCRWYL